MDIAIHLKEVVDQSYSSPSLLTLVQTVTMPTLIQHYLDTDNLSPYSIIQSTITKIGQHPTLYKDFLFKSHYEIISQMIQNEEPMIRQQISNCIHHNRLEIYEMLSYIQDEDRKSFELYFNVILTQFRDQELSVAQKIQQTLFSFGQQEVKHEKYYLLKDKHLQSSLVHILNDSSRENSEALLRCIDLVVDLSNLSQKSQEVLIDSGALSLAVKQIETKDLLFKLGVVEVLAKLGDTNHNQQFVMQSQLLEVLKEEAFQPDTEFYVQKYMVLLLSKMMNKNVIELDNSLQEKLIHLLKTLLKAYDKEQTEGVLSILSVLFQSSKLLTFIGKQPILIQLFMDNCNHTDPTLKKNFISCFSQVFFQQQDDQQKDPNMLKNIFYCLGNKQNMMSYSTINKLVDDQHMSINYLFNLLAMPFEDYETEALKVLKNLLCFEFGIKEMIQHKDFIGYMVKGYAKNKEIFDLKRDIKEHLETVTLDLSKKDAQIKQFREQYLKQMQEQKGQNTEAFIATKSK